MTNSPVRQSALVLDHPVYSMYNVYKRLDTYFSWKIL